MSIKFLVLGGGGDFGFGGGGERRFYFYGRGDFSDLFTGSRFLLRFGRFVCRNWPILADFSQDSPRLCVQNAGSL